MYANLDTKKRQRGLRLSAVTGVSKGLSDFEFPLFSLCMKNNSVLFFTQILIHLSRLIFLDRFSGSPGLVYRQRLCFLIESLKDSAGRLDVPTNRSPRNPQSVTFSVPRTIVVK